MKQILLLSDTHSYMPPTIAHHAQSCDEIWHAGDIGNIAVAEALENLKPLKAVYGNVDGADLRLRYPLNNVFNCEDVKIVMTHIGGYPGKYNSRTLVLINTHRPNIVITGHSHILKIMNDPLLAHLHINPGAAGKEGFHNICTFVKFKIEGNRIFDLQIIENKK